MKAAMRYHFTPAGMAVIKTTENECWRGCEDVEKSEPLCTAGGRGTWGGCRAERSGSSSKGYAERYRVTRPLYAR